MKQHRVVLCMTVIFGLGSAPVYLAAAEPDLVLSNVRVKRLDFCNNELRFKVKLKRPTTPPHVGTVTSSKWDAVWRDRIGLYSAEEPGLLLRSISVRNHPASKKVQFSLPSAARVDCRDLDKPSYVTRVRIHVDDLDEQVELEENNIATIDWKLQGETGFNTCYVAAGDNPCDGRPTAQSVDVASPGK